MKFSLGSRWLNDRKGVIELMMRAVNEAGGSEQYVQHYPSQAVLFDEGVPLDDIYILLEGTVKLLRKSIDKETTFPINIVREGALLGIVAFTTQRPSLTMAVAEGDVKVLKVPRHEVEILSENNPRIEEYLDEIILANLLERFSDNIKLQMKMFRLNENLNNDKQELKKAYEDLKEAQNQLVFREKMATLGQLVAGFAHEINNPTAALLRSAETLEIQIQKLLDDLYIDPATERLFRSFYDAGMNTEYPDTSELRVRSEKLKKLHPDLDRTEIRKLSLMPQDLAIGMLTDHFTLRESCIHYFELGSMFRNIRISGNRISNLVKSLKSYIRSETDSEYEVTDIREGIHDTLQLTSNRIKFYDLKLDLPEMEPIQINPAGLNQVWTNIILNASDSMGKKGSLSVKCVDSEEQVTVIICDSGPGIDSTVLETLFDPNVTTKKTGKKFGLGLGLSISRDIVHQHGGTIKAYNRKEGGACFEVVIPRN
jgi:C4-dicarboxylate-specific signal transduction histidine kinase